MEFTCLLWLRGLRAQISIPETHVFLGSLPIGDGLGFFCFVILADLHFGFSSLRNICSLFFLFVDLADT